MRAKSWLFIPAILMALVGCGQDPPGTAASGPRMAASSGVAPIASATVDAIAGNGPSARCNLETMNGINLEAARPTMDPGSAVHLEGWYANPAQAEAPLTLVLVSADGRAQWSVPLPKRTTRPDVAAAMKSEAAAMAGFEVDLDLRGLAAGDYSMYLVNPAGAPASACGLGRGFRIR